MSMKARITGITVLLISSITSFSVYGQDESPQWHLVWEDDFKQDGKPDSDNWEFSGRGTPDWARYCADSPQTTFVKDGTLHLRGIVNTTENDSVPYQTGCIQTKGKFAFKYGKLEVKAKLSKGKGSWPAIWLMPQEATYGGWPHSGEIDVMEHLNYDSIVYQTLHSNYINVQGEREHPIHSQTSPIKADDFNVFGMEWYPDRIDFFVNGEKTLTYPKMDEADWQQWPFDQQFYIILDQALGGSWVGSIKDEDLPVEMVVDWVRVYQEKS